MKTAIETAIEYKSVLDSNNRSQDEFDKGVRHGAMLYSKYLNDLLPIERGVMKHAFTEGRLTHPMVGFKHDSFDDYFTDFKL